MGLEEFGDLPSRLEDWTYETVMVVPTVKTVLEQK